MSKMPSQSRSKPGGKDRGKPGKVLSKKDKNSMELEQPVGERVREFEIENKEE